ncbi:MAG: transcription-repair coupling factor [Eggerthellales bacterium]|nr:transcription-repair coupling factor [Eggerthellales bacterium]
MLIDSLVFRFERTEALKGFWDKLDRGEDATLGVASSARPLMVAMQFARKPQSTLVVIAGEEAALGFARSVASYLGEDKVLRFMERSDYPGSAKGPDLALCARRMEAAYALRTAKPCVVVASARALTRLLPPANAHACDPLVLRCGDDLSDGVVAGLESYEDVPRYLVERGYENAGDQLDGKGTFAVHGGTIDIYPGNLQYPVRVDFFGDEIDEIRRIVPTTGQTISSLRAVEIFPVIEYAADAKAFRRARKALESLAKTNSQMRELLGYLENMESGVRFPHSDLLLPFLYEETSTLGDYAGPDTLTALVEPKSLFDDSSHAYDEACAKVDGCGVAVDNLFAPPTQLNFGAGLRATYLSLMGIGKSVDEELPVKRTDVAGKGGRLMGRLRNFLDADFMVVFAAANAQVRKEMELDFVDEGLPIHEVLEWQLDGEEQAKRRLRAGVVNIIDAEIPLGMVFPKAKLALVSIADTQGARSVSSAARKIDITEITFPYKPGDYVVHAVHGVALFSELTRREIDGSVRDYLLLEYAEGDKLYVPVEQLDRVTRYVGPEGSTPRPTRLNTSDWSRALRKASKATKKLAFDLVDVYARRAATPGFRFGADTPWQQEMEDSFPYTETPDQLAAIQDVKTDMMSGRPMDRLICGDVGFGKTEVALRAAFKATQDKKQVMVLCPTTILAQQHYTNFRERFEPFGITVEVLSRFRTAAQQREALKGFADGTVEVLVGTHRLLSRDVNPYDLGLVIIDEEQRFGVGHKEQFKNLRESVDVLTLSATPIPRTMQMSMSGVRDMSVILTPPDDRRPVKVHVGEWDPDVVSGAIRYELARGGQVYYVSNRVRTIDDAVERVREAAGEARVGVAHGQMTKEQLESVMEEFAAGELDVLVATTIIESGIDNPHTNTLIIEDSQRLGLAQMYQLKGRVGRSSVQAFAYFMYPEKVVLTEEATARLLAINEHQELGSGMRIAMRDLEIRGAGDILGAEQSGQMSAVGFDLFAQMLGQAVLEARTGTASDGGEVVLPPALSDITVNIPGKTYLSDDYLPNVDERVLWYRRIASAATVEQAQAIQEDLEGKHPDMPVEARNLFLKTRVKAYCNEHDIKSIVVAGGKLTIEPVAVTREKSLELRRAGGKYIPEKKRLSVPMKYFKLGDEDTPLGVLSAFLESLELQEGEKPAPKPKAAPVTPRPTTRAKEGVGHNSFARKSSSSSSTSSSRTSASRTAAERRNMTTRTIHRRHNW